MNRSALSTLLALDKGFTTEFFRQVTLQVRHLSHCLDSERTHTEILQSLGLKDQTNLAKKLRATGPFQGPHGSDHPGQTPQQQTEISANRQGPESCRFV